MSALGQRIKTYREARGWSQEDLAAELSRAKGKKVSRESVSQWETGEGYPRAENVIALATVFSKPKWEFQRFGGDTASRSSDAERHLIAWLRWPDMKHVTADGKVLKPALKKLRHLEADKDTPPLAYALTIEDESMAARFMPGDEIIIDPGMRPRDKRDDPDFVLARIKKTGQVIFREYRRRGASQEVFDLVGYHKDCKTVSAPSCNVELLGTMVEHRRKRRTS